MNRPLGSILFLIVVTVVGCQSDKPKYANVKGTVTFNGKPIEKGQIIFEVEGRMPSAMQIVDGAFNGQAMVGSNIVSVSAKRKSTTAPKVPKNAEIQIKGYLDKFKKSPQEGGGDIAESYDATMVEYIPPEWGAKSKEVRVIEAGSTNEIEINIKGKN